MGGRIDLSAAPVRTGAINPVPFEAQMAGRATLWLRDAGEPPLMPDTGPTVMRAGDCAAFPAGNCDGHCLVDESDRAARFLVIGTGAARELATYSDVDLQVTSENGTASFTRKHGSPYKEPSDA